jgi:hypothetical protein
VSRIVAGFCIALGVWLGGFLAALAPGAPAALALGAFGLLSTLTAAAWRLAETTSETSNAAEPTLSRALGSAATPTSSRR